MKTGGGRGGVFVADETGEAVTSPHIYDPNLFGFESIQLLSPRSGCDVTKVEFLVRRTSPFDRARSSSLLTVHRLLCSQRRGRKS